MNIDADSESLLSQNDVKSEEDSLRTAQEESSLLGPEEEEGEEEEEEMEDEEMMEGNNPEADESIEGGEEEEQEEEAPLSTTLNMHMEKKANGSDTNAPSQDEDDRSSIAYSQESGKDSWRLLCPNSFKPKDV